MRKFILLVLCCFLSCVTAKPCGDRPDTWAQPVDLEGVENFYQVDDMLYRSAQPSREGFANFPVIGGPGSVEIDTIVNLRRNHSDAKALEGLPIELIEIPVNTWDLSEDDVVKFLSVFNRSLVRTGAVLVHCQHGSDRTGAMIAAYRIVIQGWTKEQAIDEMVHGGYGFHPIWQNLVHFIHTLDVDAIKRRLREPVLESKGWPWTRNTEERTPKSCHVLSRGKYDDRYVSDCCHSRVYRATVEMFDGPTCVYVCDYCGCACGVEKRK